MGISMLSFFIIGIVILEIMINTIYMRGDGDEESEVYWYIANPFLIILNMIHNFLIKSDIAEWIKISNEISIIIMSIFILKGIRDTVKFGVKKGKYSLLFRIICFLVVSIILVKEKL